MKIRMLPTDDFSEFGRSSTMILMLSINPTEAHAIRDILGDAEEAQGSIPACAAQFNTALAAVIVARPAVYDEVNTDGRSERIFRESEPNGVPR